MYRKASVQRNRRWVGIRQGDAVVHLWGSPIDQKRAESVRGRVHALVSREIFLSAYALSDSDMARHAETMRRVGMRLLIGYPSVLCEFGRFCAARGIRFDHLKAVICSAEALYEPQREVIRETLGAPVFNRYGCREVGDIAQEAAPGAGLVVNADRMLVEIVDEAGEPVQPGQMGEILVTDLDNFGMPLIRYRIGDMGAWSDHRHPGLPFPVLERVEGRSLDVVRSPTGERIGGTFWTILVRQRPGILQVQVVQPALDRVILRYVRDPAVGSVDLDYLRARIREKCGPDLQVEFEEVAAIQPEPTGKFRLVKSEIAA